jgi:hypothetical protein
LSSLLDYKSALNTHFYYYGRWKNLLKSFSKHYTNWPK